MSQTMTPDPERGDGPGGPVDDRRDDPTTTPKEQPKAESNFGDSSGPLFSVYSKAADEEDNKMAERWQKDAEGILIFTGLFSAAVAALLAVTVQDLRPNSQDISAFYLGNIYQVLADPNATPPSTPPPVAKPPSFSPSRNAVWVNTLWFLSLVMSVSCALWATSLQQWARRYLHLAQPARCSPERRARMRAFFAGGVDKMHIPWAVEGLPMLLHISLFLFFGGLAIFLFDVDREVFRYVICWIGLFLMVYGMITLLPLIRQDSPYNSPLSEPAWFLHATVTYVTLKILFFVIYVCSCLFFCFCFCICSPVVERVVELLDDWADYGRRRMSGGVEKAAEEMALERSSEIDLQILDWTISALGDDDSLKNFFETIPGFFNSKFVLVDHQRRFPTELVEKFKHVLGGFLIRTCSSNSVDDSEKARRVAIALAAINQIGQTHGDRLIDHGRLTNNGQDIPAEVQDIIAEILLSVWERSDSWVVLAARLYCLPERDIALGGDNLSLATLTHISRQYLRSNYRHWRVMEALSKLEIDIDNTLPRLQHDFCTLWNELVRKARNERSDSNSAYIIEEINHVYIALHRGTDAALDPALILPSSFPFCDLASHRPDSTAHVSLPLPTPPGNSPDASSHPTNGGNTASRQAEQVNDTIEPASSSDPTKTSKIRVTSHGPDIVPPTNPVYSRSHPTVASTTVVVATAPLDITSAATLSRPLEGSEQHDSDIVTPRAEPGTTTASTRAPVPIPAPIPTSPPKTPSESNNAGVASNSSRFAPPSIGSSETASRPTGSSTLPRLRPRGLVNTRNICFANAVLQLLVNSPPFWNLFRELGYLKNSEQRGAGVAEPGGGATPLVDATVRFFREFLVEEGSPSTQQRLQRAAGGTSRAGEGKRDFNVVDSFEPTYMYDAMKGKTQLKPLLDGQQQDAEEFLCLYLDALDEELPALLAFISGGRPVGAALQIEEREVPQSEVGTQDVLANLVESPITHIFGVKFRLPVCGPNQPDPVPTEDWRSLHLDIQHDSIRTVQDALAHISLPQSTVTMQDITSGLGNASQHVLGEALPPVLVLHLNRVQYDAAAGGITKIGKSIQLTPELEIPLGIMVQTVQRSSEPPRYKLYGVVYHHGESAGSGHYTVDVLRPNNNGGTGEVWLHIDDETVTRMRHEDVFGEHGTERAADEQSAYLLFYCRTSEIGT